MKSDYLKRDALFATALLTGVLFVAVDRRIMRNQPSSPVALAVVGITTLAIFGAGDRNVRLVVKLNTALLSIFAHGHNNVDATATSLEHRL